LYQQSRPCWAGKSKQVKTKVQKRNEARKNAEAVKAARKATRQGKTALMNASTGSKKGKSSIPQSKTRAKK